MPNKIIEINFFLYLLSACFEEEISLKKRKFAKYYLERWVVYKKMFK